MTTLVSRYDLKRMMLICGELFLYLYFRILIEWKFLQVRLSQSCGVSSHRIQMKTNEHKARELLPGSV